jgi:hypothetical protein
MILFQRWYKSPYAIPKLALTYLSGNKYAEAILNSARIQSDSYSHIETLLLFADEYRLSMQSRKLEFLLCGIPA